MREIKSLFKNIVNHSKKNITSDTCVICGAPRKWLHKKLEWEECLICTKAKVIVNLDDLRTVIEKHHHHIPTKEESLVKAINFYQERDKYPNTGVE